MKLLGQGRRRPVSQLKSKSSLEQVHHAAVKPSEKMYSLQLHTHQHTLGNLQAAGGTHRWRPWRSARVAACRLWALEHHLLRSLAHLQHTLKASAVEVSLRVFETVCCPCTLATLCHLLMSSAHLQHAVWCQRQVDHC